MTRRLITVAGGIALIALGVWATVSWFEDSPREVTTTSDLAYELYQEGEGHVERYDLEAAAAAFTAAVEADSTFAMAHLQLSGLMWQLGRRDDAQEHLERAAELTDSVSEVERLWIERAVARYSDEPDRVQKLTAELAERFPDHPWVLRLLGEQARQRGEYTKALTAFDRALELDPEAVDIHNKKGYIYLGMGEYEKAVQSFQRYAFYAPDQANPHDSLGEAYFYTGRFEEATKEFLRALEIDPGFIWAGVHLADVLGVTGQLERAHRVLDEFEPVFEERGLEDWLAQQRMTIDLRADRWEQVLERARAEIERLEGVKERRLEYLVSARFMRTLSLLELGRVDEARESLESLAESSSAMGELLGDSPRFAEIERLHLAMIESRFGRAEGEPARGIEALSTAIDEAESIGPHELTFFRHELARAQWAADRPEAAAATVDTALDEIPTLPRMNLLAARIKADLGRRDEALAHLRTHLEVMRYADEGHPSVVQAQRMLQRLVPRS